MATYALTHLHLLRCLVYYLVAHVMSSLTNVNKLEYLALH